MSADDLVRRIGRTQEQIGEAGLVALLVGPGADLVYLTGYSPPPLERLTLLVLPPFRDPILVVPMLERPGALQTPLGDRLEVLGWTDAEDPYRVIASLLPDGPAAVTDQTWASHVLELQRAAPGTTLVPSGEALPLLRAVKDGSELDALRSAGAAADEAFAEIVGTRFEGRRERDVAADLAELLRARDHETVDFTIVGAGPNGASPHHEAGDRMIRVGDLVVMDFGGHRHGYCSDMTRTVSVGEPTQEQRLVYEVVRSAQESAFEAIRPGVRAQDVDRAARAVIVDAGFGDRFIHRTGHGIGLEVHEPPYIVEGNETALEAGMTFSDEPGIYLPERFGVRIEDIVAVTEEGATRLNEARRDLIVVA